MNFSSSNWDIVHGCCTKHGIPEIPCQQCFAEKDKDIQVTVTEADHAFLEGEIFIAEQNGETPPTLKDLLPATDADWLIDRIN